MKYLLGIFFILMFSQVYAVCESGQIDINSASASELDELSGIGPVKAKAIIDSRPFDSVNELIDVYGIGPSTIEKIKEQDLACVEEEYVKEIEEDVETEEDEDSEVIKYYSLEKEEILNGNPEPEIIKLNTKNIKSNDNNGLEEKPEAKRFAIYGFLIFCFLLGFLFIIRRRRKSEFD